MRETFDEAAAGMIRAVNKHNCRVAFYANAERVAYFVKRIHERGDDAAEVGVVILAVNDPHGAAIAEGLMPGFDWQPIIDRGEVPYARGIVDRFEIAMKIALFDTEAAEKVRTMPGVVAIVVDNGVAAVFDASQRRAEP